MGTNNHASFSSQSKSNLQSLKKRIKKKGLKVKTKGDNHQKNDGTDRKEGRSRTFWWKWLNFVRWNWSGHGNYGQHAGPKSARRPMRSFVTTSGSNATSMDVIEIPIETGQKISKILIKPTRTGIKAMIAQCRAQGDDSRLSERDSSSDGRMVELKMRAEERGEYQEKSRAKTRKSEVVKAKKKESLLTSALFIRRDMDNIVESAVFIEPTLPNDYLDSGQSEDSLKINKRRVSYRIIDERNCTLQQTLKTVSEPTWIEKREILRRQRLQDNLNTLLEQFMFLEADDVVGLTVTNERRTPLFSENPALHINEHAMKEISRQVSPEILVNIKPFKEYLSDDYIKIEGPEFLKPKKAAPRPSKRPAGQRENRRKAEEQLAPMLHDVMASDNDYARVLKNYPEIMSSVQTITMKKEVTTVCYEKEKKPRDLNPLPKLEEAAPSVCAVWGVCKTYSGCKISSRKEETIPEKTSLDEVLNTLDDSDHDVVFQKNISQFRKKITSTPRLDFKKCGGRIKDAKIKEPKKKPKRRQCQVEFSRPIIECVAEESEEEKNWLQESEGHKTNCLWLERWECEKKRGKMLGTPCLLFFERNLVNRVFACRMEEAVVNTLATMREVQSPVEEIHYIVVQREKTMRCSGKIKEISLVAVKRPEGLRSLKMPTNDTNLDAVRKMFEVQGDGFDCSVGADPGPKLNECPRKFPFFSNITDCFYMIHSPVPVNSELLEPCDKNQLSIEKLSMDWAEPPRGKFQDNYIRHSQRKKILHSVYEEEQTVTEILHTPVDYLLAVHESGPNCIVKQTSVESASRSQPEAKLPENVPEQSEVANDNSKQSIVDEVDKHKIPDIDGFKILFNVRDNLTSDDDETVNVKSEKSFEDQRLRVFLEAEELAPKATGEKIGEAEKAMFSNESDVLSGGVDRKLSRFLNFKSSSSPKESIIQNEFGSPEHRTRRSLVLAKETENILQTCKKRRSSGDKGMEIRRTGSALTEALSPKLGQEKVFIDPKSSSGGEKKFGSLVLPEELKMKIGPELRTLEKKIHLSDCSKMNVRKEVIAVFNSIKELNSLKAEGRGGNKRMSLVIMLSKK